MYKRVASQFGFCTLVALCACGDHTDLDSQPTTRDVASAGRAAPIAPVGSPGNSIGPSASPAAGRGVDANLAAGSSANTSVAKPGTSAAGSAAPADGAAPPASAMGVPCDVAKIVGANCVSCHGNQLNFGAPMPLLTLDDFRAMSKSNAQRHVFEVAYDRVTAQDTQKRMPPVSKPALPALELTKFTDWLHAGALAGADSCPIQEIRPSEPAKTTPGGMGSASTHPIEYNDPDTECFKFTAYAPGQRGAKFSVPTTPDAYFNFIMKAPWQGTKYIRSFKTVNDNMQAIHHWIFFKNTSNQPEAVVSSSGAHPDALRLYGWSPGADDFFLDPDVGMKAESNVSYTLEAHYNNTSGLPATDASGVEVCVTSKVPKYEVLQAWVGTDTIAGTTATGVCTPVGTEPIHVIAAHPHMHKKGQHMKVVVTRADGKQEVVHDEPFSFDYQRLYLKDFVLNPGDSMATTCTWSSPATFGTSTEDEMCYFFPVYWPAGALVGGGLEHALWSGLHGPNTCMN